MNATLFNKPQGSGSRAQRKSWNGGSSRSPASTTSLSPNHRVPSGSSSWERSASTGEAYFEDRGTQPPTVPRQQLEATVSTLN